MYKVYRAGVIKIEDGKYIDNANHTEWAIYNKWLNQGNRPLPQDPEPHQDKTVDDVCDAKIDRLREMRRKLRGRLHSTMGGGDNAIWLMLQKEEAGRAGAPGKMIAEMARVSGLTVQQVKKHIADRIPDKKLEFAGQLEGIYLKHKLALKSFTTKHEIEDYDIDSGWPDIPLPRSKDR